MLEFNSTQARNMTVLQTNSNVTPPTVQLHCNFRTWRCITKKLGLSRYVSIVIQDGPNSFVLWAIFQLTYQLAGQFTSNDKRGSTVST